MNAFTPIFDPENHDPVLTDEKFIEHNCIKHKGVIHALQGGGQLMKDKYGDPFYVFPRTWCGIDKVEDLSNSETTWGYPTCQQCFNVLSKRENSEE